MVEGRGFGGLGFGVKGLWFCFCSLGLVFGVCFFLGFGFSVEVQSLELKVWS